MISIGAEFNDKVIKLITELKHDYPKYIMKKSLKRLCTFLHGHLLFATTNDNITNIFKNEKQPMFPDLSLYVYYRLRDYDNENMFIKIMKHYPDDSVSFDIFYTILDEYIDIYKISKQTNSLRYIKAKPYINNDILANLTVHEKYFKSLNNVKNYPGAFFVQSSSINSLESFMNGYYKCAKIYNTNINPHPKFEEFIKQKYKNYSTSSIYEIIGNQYKEKEAFEMFFKLLSEHLTENNMYVYSKLLNNTPIKS